MVLAESGVAVDFIHKKVGRPEVPRHETLLPARLTRLKKLTLDLFVFSSIIGSF